MPQGLDVLRRHPKHASIDEGNILLLPPNIPHSPQRPDPESIGMVVERVRPPGIADAFLVPQLYNARRFKCPLAAYPTIVRIDAQCREHPAFVAAAPENQPDAA